MILFRRPDFFCNLISIVSCVQCALTWATIGTPTQAGKRRCQHKWWNGRMVQQRLHRKRKNLHRYCIFFRWRRGRKRIRLHCVGISTFPELDAPCETSTYVLDVDAPERCRWRNKMHRLRFGRRAADRMALSAFTWKKRKSIRLRDTLLVCRFPLDFNINRHYVLIAFRFDARAENSQWCLEYLKFIETEANGKESKKCKCKCNMTQYHFGEKHKGVSMPIPPSSMNS